MQVDLRCGVAGNIAGRGRRGLLRCLAPRSARVEDSVDLRWVRFHDHLKLAHFFMDIKSDATTPIESGQREWSCCLSQALILKTTSGPFIRLISLKRSLAIFLASSAISCSISPI
jgi:hypothetical protein